MEIKAIGVIFIFQYASIVDILTLNTSTANYRWRDVQKEILEDHTGVCGASRVCNVTFEGLTTTWRQQCSVCDICFCDDLCQEYGDCCLDKVILDTLMDKYINETEPVRKPRHVECTDLRVKGIEYSRLEGQAKQRLISKCPENFHDQALQSECEDYGFINKNVYNLDISPDQLTQNWPVASPRSSLFYKNQACAKCHSDGDENSLVSWGLKLSCEQMPNMPVSADPSTVLAAFLKEPLCEVIFTTPDGMEPRACQFPEDTNLNVIDRCNMTGERFVYEDLLWRSCDVLPVLSKYDIQAYSNPFCARCQADTILILRPTCSYGGAFPFFILLSPDAMESAQRVRARYDCRCRNNYIYDPYKESCRRIHCATGRTFVDGECVSTVSSGNGQHYSLSLSLTSPWLERDASFDTYPSTPSLFEKIAYGLQEAFFDEMLRFIKQDNFIDLNTFLVHVEQVTELSQNFSANLYIEFEVLYPQNQDSFEKHLLSLCNQSWTLTLPGTNESLRLEPSAQTKPNTTFVERFTAGRVYTTSSSDVYRQNKTEFFILIPKMFAMFWTPFNTGKESQVYTEIRNTLICPHLIYDLVNTTDIKVEKDHAILPWPHNKEILLHIKTGVELSPEDFSYTDDGRVIICVDQIEKKMKLHYDNQDLGGIEGVDVFGTGLVVTSHICLSISSLCLALTFITYCLFPALRTLPGKSTMFLVMNLLLAIVLFLSGGFVQESSVECQIIGVATHYFLLSFFVWMLLCSAHMYSVFSNIMEQSAVTKSETAGRFRVYFAVSCLIPALIVFSTVMSNYFLTNSSSATHNDQLLETNIDDAEETEPMSNSCSSKSKVRIGYGHGICYLSNKLSLLLAGALPIAAICTANLVIYILTLMAFRRMSDQEKVARREPRSHLLIYLKISTLTGINWLPCTVAAFVSSAIVWYSFLILCGLQGLYVFLSFVCNKRVLGLYRQLLTSREASSSQSTRNQGEGKQTTNRTHTCEKYMTSSPSNTKSNGHNINLHTKDTNTTENTA